MLINWHKLEVNENLTVNKTSMDRKKELYSIYYSMTGSIITYDMKRKKNTGELQEIENEH